MTEHHSSKRKFLKTAVYVAPAILTLKAIPSFASSGSGRGNENDPGNGHNPQPPGNPPVNDDDTSLGDPKAHGGYKKHKRQWYQRWFR